MIFILQASLYLCRCHMLLMLLCHRGENTREPADVKYSVIHILVKAAAFHVKQMSDAEKRKQSKTRLWCWIVCFYWNSVSTHSKASCGLLFPDVTAVLCSLIKPNLNLFCEFVAQTCLTAGAVRGSDQRRCWGYWLLICVITVCVWGCVSV